MKRFYHIDFLRAISVIIVVIIHVLSYNLNNSVHYFYWNYLNFVVTAFVFCSAYVLEVGHGKKINTSNELITWWKKRLSRLLIPFYIYLLFHYLLWIIFPNFFTGSGLQKSLSFLIKSIFLYGGVDANWLPLLFIELALIYPLLKAIQKNKKLLILYMAFSLLITGFYTYSTIISQSLYRYYRSLMIIPYSLVALLAMRLVNKDSFKKYLVIIFFSLLSFLILLFFWPILGKISLFNQKYPPNLYYLSYSLMLTLVVILFSYCKIFQINFVKKFIVFTSAEAYTLFFVSYLVLDFIQKQRQHNLFINNIFLQLLFVISLSYLFVYILKLLRR